MTNDTTFTEAAPLATVGCSETPKETTVNDKATKTEKTPKAKVACWCGCGGQTGGRFVPGHDARFHGLAKKVARGQTEAGPILSALPHEDAREHFLHHADEAAKTADAWLANEAEKARKRAEKAAEKAQKAAEKTAEPIEDAVDRLLATVDEAAVPAS